MRYRTDVKFEHCCFKRRIEVVQFHIMADAHRDFLLPPGWIPGAYFRLTRGVHRRDGTLRSNTRGFVHRIYDGHPGRPARAALQKKDVWFDVTAQHCITGIYFDKKWTAVQFCPDPDRRPLEKVWTNVRKRNDWWADIVND